MSFHLVAALYSMLFHKRTLLLRAHLCELICAYLFFLSPTHTRPPPFWFVSRPAIGAYSVVLEVSISIFFLINQPVHIYLTIRVLLIRT